MEQSNDIMKQAIEWVGALWALPVRVVLFLLLVALCQMIKKSPRVENWLIPWIITVLGAVGAWAILTEVPSAATTPIANGLMGALAGWVAHIVHYKILANPDSKFPLIGGLLTGDGDTEFLEKQKDGLPPEGPKLP